MSYEEVLLQLGYIQENENWILTQNKNTQFPHAKVIIDTRVPFRERALPSEQEVHLEKDMGKTLPGTDEEEFKKSILDIEMKPVSFRRKEL